MGRRKIRDIRAVRAPIRQRRDEIHTLMIPADRTGREMLITPGRLRSRECASLDGVSKRLDKYGRARTDNLTPSARHNMSRQRVIEKKQQHGPEFS